MIRHHLSPTTLAAYAAGSLSEALSLVAATHIGQCAACSGQVTAAERQAGAMIEAQAPVALQEGALQATLERLERPPPTPPPVLNPDLPPPLNRVRFGRSWPIGLGFRWRPMRSAGSAWGGLLLVQPHRSIPRHGHAGLELTCVLRGAFADDARMFEAGDIAEQTADHQAPLRVVGTEPCLCILATEGLRFRGLPGWAQRRRVQP
jgi:putative transcriptional regulator